MFAEKQHPKNRAPYYKFVQGLPYDTVKCYGGETEYRVNTISIGGIFYIRGVHASFNEETGSWDLDKTLFLKRKGIIQIDEKTGTPVIGEFDYNPYTYCEAHYNSERICCNDYKILLSEFYQEDYSNGVFYNITNFTKQQILSLKKKKLHKDNRNAAYNIEDNKVQLKTSIELYEKNILPIDNDLKLLSSYIKDVTFGLEYETINGFLPDYICNQLGIIICKDGSIKNQDGGYPPEYVTVPLKGVKGLQTIRNLCSEMQLRSEIDIRCSLHVHLGGFKMDRIFLVGLFRLCTKIQNDVFAMFPYYKSHYQGYKEKDYCKKLPDILCPYGNSDFNEYINECYQDMYLYMTEGRELSNKYNRKKRTNPFGEHKWNIPTRYHWVNFINPFFGKRDTIEFRLHTPTLNADKSINWLLMCVAIIKYAQANTLQCINDSNVLFTDVLNYYRDSRSTAYAAHLSKRLAEYYENRVEYFKNDVKKKNYTSEEELLTDNNFIFNVTNINVL